MELKNIINSKEKEQTIKDKIMKEMKHDYEKSNKQLQDILQQKNDLKKTVNTLKLSIQVILDRLSFNKNEAEDENKHPDHIIENKEVPEYLFKLEKKTNKILYPIERFDGMRIIKTHDSVIPRKSNTKTEYSNTADQRCYISHIRISISKM